MVIAPFKALTKIKWKQMEEKDKKVNLGILKLNKKAK